MPRKLIHRLNDIRLRDKMLGSYILLLLLPLLIMGIVLMAAFRNSALDEAVKQTESNVDRVKSRTTELLDVAINLSNRLATDNQMKSTAIKRYGSVLDVFLAYRNYQTFRIFQDFNADVSRIKLYTDNPTLVDNWEFIPLDQATAATSWYRAAIANPEKIGWLWFPDITRPATSTLSLVRSIWYPEVHNYGVLVIDVNTDRLNAMLQAEPFTTLIVDANTEVVAATDRNLVGKDLDTPELKRLLQSAGAGSYEVAIGKVASKVFVEDIQVANSFNALRIISIFPIERMVERANQISLIGLAVMVGIFVLALVFISFMYSTLANRILSLSRLIDLVSRGHFATFLPVDGKDEIGIISSQFNGMVGNIATLLEQVRVANEQKSRLELSQKEIRLKMLASQINPHFLFNALESIRMKAHLRGEKDIAQTVKLLGRLMRKNLEAGDGLIPLRQELESVRCYLEIEKFRLEDQLNYRFEVEPETEAVLVPPLIIEPLVENAVIHGLENKIGGGTVVVRVWRDAGLVRFEVSDNGSGMSPATLGLVHQGLDLPDSHHIGLSNVHQRLVLGYGQEHGLVIGSRNGGGDGSSGTCINFSLPGSNKHD